jgi:hypothetical protein
VLGGLAGFAGKFYSAMIKLGHTVGDPEFAELMPVRAESVGFDELRAGLHIGLVGAENFLRMRRIQLLHATLPLFVEKRAHRAVSHEDGRAQPLAKVFNSHGVSAPGSFPGRGVNQKV